MSVLVTAVDGYHILTSSGKHLTSLEGHRVEAFTPGAGGTWLAIVDRQEIWQHGTDGDVDATGQDRRRPHRRRRDRHDRVRRHRRRAVLRVVPESGAVEAARRFRRGAGSRLLAPGGHARSRCAR